MNLTPEARAGIDATWNDEIVPALMDYVAIPNVSPAYEPRWAELGHMDVATEMFRAWAADRKIEGMSVEVVRLGERTPVILIEVAAIGEADPDAPAVLLYGHLDKQQEMEGWDEGKGPWTPIIEDGRMYGRGGADDGYAMFASLAAIEAVRTSGAAHRRLVVLIEASEESGSPDRPAYIDHLAPRLGDIDFVVCLDSGCADYENLWVTTSLRGVVGGTLSVEILEEGVHSGSASGVVPSSFRILRQLLSRVEDPATGEVLVPECQADVSESRLAQIGASADSIGGGFGASFPFVSGARPVDGTPMELILNRTWRSTLSVVGFDGAPAPGAAGNVLRPRTRAQLSFRLPPTVDHEVALAAIERTLTDDPPYGARVTFDDPEGGPGWAAPELESWLAVALDRAGQAHFGAPAQFMGEGGSIPFMAMLGERFPAAQFVITGVLGPGSNAHGPNEFLDLSMGRRLTACVAEILMEHAGSPTLHAV
jgi:acetylornithine deacetylase/succinyl-diaminopimelate desuccinylase-like protein